MISSFYATKLTSRPWALDRVFLEGSLSTGTATVTHRNSPPNILVLLALFLFTSSSRHGVVESASPSCLVSPQRCCSSSSPPQTSPMGLFSLPRSNDRRTHGTSGYRGMSNPSHYKHSCSHIPYRSHLNSRSLLLKIQSLCRSLPNWSLVVPS